MNTKITSISQRDCSVDYSVLKEELANAEYDELSPSQIEEKLYKEHGVVPAKIAVENIEKFNIRRAFFDVYKSTDETKKGVWHLEKDADGNEFIVRADEQK